MDTVTRLKQLRERAKETQTKVTSATATVQHADRELSDARQGLKDIPALGLDPDKKLAPQIERLVAEVEQELTEAETSTAEIDAAIQGEAPE